MRRLMMNLCVKDKERPVGDLGEMFCDLTRQSFRFGMAVMDAFCAAAREPFQGFGCLSNLSGCLPRRSSCEIPPPCWIPKSLGQVNSAVCPGGTATVRVGVTNCGTESRVFRVDAPGATDLKITPA